MPVVYAKRTVGISRGRVLRKGAAYDSEAVEVREYPNEFEAEPAKVHGRVVERATARPGEKRVTPPRKRD